MTDDSDRIFTPDRRKFSRITFNATTQLTQDAKQWDVQLLDLSLKGLLAATPSDWVADIRRPFTATITLDDGSPIVMSLRWRHGGEGRAGFVCDHIDIDSITHLRRLVELNLGNSALLERELAALGF